MTTGEPAFETIPSANPDEDGLIELPLLVVPGQVVYPSVLTPILIGSQENAAAVNYAQTHHQTLIATMRSGSGTMLPLMRSIHLTATEAALSPLAPDASIVLAQGRRRVEIVAIAQEKPFYLARARILDEPARDDLNTDVRLQTVLDLFQQILQLNETISDDVAEFVLNTESPSEFADLVASTLDLDPAERQRLLEEVNVEERLEHLSRLLRQELNTLEARDDVHASVQQEMARSQREVYLREQMRVIQTELGEEDPFQQEVNDLRERILSVGMSQEATSKAIQELQRLLIMSPMSPEASIVRTYIDWLIAIPWSATTRDNLNLKNAEKTLEEAHYGLEKVKERILEHIAVRKLAREHMKSPILCFVGPPGVGKTSLGQSIAKALGREFVRVSLGGIRDEAEIRGHRRTYIGALPGRIMQTLKRIGTNNPVMMLDEIDKLSSDYRGDPAAALLEVLDPEQNREFVDNYLEVPYDLSHVLFITTANDLFPLPEALEDRLEVIEFRSYTEEEKVEIARRFLIPKELKAHGLERRGIRFQADALSLMIRQYTLEAGVRNLEREIANICRKIARLVATRKPFPRRITPRLVETYLGPPYVPATLVNREDSIGVATGLVWTSGGGDTQVVEASLLPGKGTLMLTGQLGDVLQESAQAALSYMRARATEFDVPHDDFENYDVHIHLPEGSVPKDGPSAGITLATAIISVFTERRIRSEFAMTGEITLRGHVLPVGGIKEKVLAARRHGIKRLILPSDNRKDLIDVPKVALKDLEIFFVDHMHQVIELTLLEAPEQRLRDLESEEDDDLDEVIDGELDDAIGEG